jgi:integrase
MAVFKKHKDGKVQKRKDGSVIWCVSWTDHQGKRQTKNTFRTEREAVAYEAEMRHNTNQILTREEAHRQTLATVALEYLEHAKTYQRQSTHIITKGLVNNYVVNAEIGAKPLCALTRDMVKSYLLEIQYEVSLDRARRIKIGIGAVFSFAVDKGYIDYNFIKDLHITKQLGFSGVKAIDPATIPTIEQVNQILEYTDKNNDKFMYVLISVLIKTGIRIGEARALTFANVKNNHLYICQNADIKGNITAPKNGLSRTVPVPVSLINLLQEWRRTTNFNRTTDFVFASIEGHVISDATVRSRLKKVYAQMGNGDWWPFHAFRHAYATQMLTVLNADVRKLQKWLGHAKPSITLNVYAHHIDALLEVDETMDQFDQYLTAPSKK